jgi:multidrug resistance efflux pump
MIEKCVPVIFMIALATSPLAAQPAKDRFVVSAPGRVGGAGDVIPIGTSVSGIVEELLIKNGDRVTKGQVLVQINCRAIQAEIRQREAEATVADVVLSRVKAGARDEETAIAMAVVRVAEARAEEAERTFRRLSTLQEGIASRARILEMERDSKMTAAQLLEARMRLRMLEAGARGEDVIEAEAKKAAAIAAIDQARARFSNCTIVAPTDGVVLTTNASPGQFVEASVGAGPLLRMVDDRFLRVRAELDEQHLEKVCLNQRAEVTADGFKGVSLSAEVTQVSPGMGRGTNVTADRAEKSDRDIREVLLRLESKETRWPIGLLVSVSFLKC